MQIKDILGIIKSGVFSEWDGVFKLFSRVSIAICFFFNKVTREVS